MVLSMNRNQTMSKARWGNVKYRATVRLEDEDYVEDNPGCETALREIIESSDPATLSEAARAEMNDIIETDQIWDDLDRSFRRRNKTNVIARQERQAASRGV